jgi:hypothetical protein
MVSNWVTTEEMPVAMTTRIMAQSMSFFKILDLVCQDFQFGALPGIGG